MRTSIPKNNFSSGQIDRDVKGRFDLPLLQNGHEISRNFFHTVKGDCYYRTGFEFIDEIGYSALYEFKFNQEQSYLLIFTTENIKFWSYSAAGEFVEVLNNNDEPLTVSHPWGNEIFNLNMTQNCDVLYINHNDGHYAEYQLKRTSANSFTLDKTTYTNNGEASLDKDSESTNHGFPCTCAFYENRLNRCSSSKYPTYLYGSKGADYDDITTGTGTNDGYQFDLAEANSKALWLMSGVNSLLVGTAEGILTINGGSVTSAITPEDISAKLSCREGVSSVKPIHKDNYVFFVSGNKRQLYMFEYDVLLEQFKATSLSKGNYEITKGGINKLANKLDRFGLIFALCGTKLLSICFSNDEAVNSWSEYITDGDFIDICSVTRPDGNFDLFAIVKRDINGSDKYYLERLTETVEFSRFEDFVSTVDKSLSKSEIQEIKQEDKYAFYRQIAEELRECNYLDSSIKYSGFQDTNISFNSETNILTVNEEEYTDTLYNSTYEDAELSNGFIKITLTSEMTGVKGAKSDTVGIYKSGWVNDLSGLSVGANLYKVVNKDIYDGNYSSLDTSTTWRKIRFANYLRVLNGTDVENLYYQGAIAKNKELYADIRGTKIFVGTISALNTIKKTITINADTLSPSEGYYMGEITSIDTSLKTICIKYYKKAFKASDVGKRIWYKTITGREYGIFDITGFIDNYNVRVNKVLEPTNNSCSSWYLSATYFSGLEHLEGETVSVVGNGGYIGDYVVKNGEIDISNANVNKVGTAIIGLKYKGILKSPNLGLMLQSNGSQTFSNMKNIYKIGLQMSFSAGVKVGSNLYDLQDVQDFNPEGLYDIPPLPMDEYREVLCEDDYDKEKHYFVVQDSPLPLHLTAIIPHYKHINKV